MTQKTKFMTLNQNNSGGYWYQNEVVDAYVIIEGYDLEHIQSRAEEILDPYRDYCPCCGERWYDDIVDEDDLTDTPTIYGTPVHEYKSFWKGTKVIIHYVDGSKDIIELGNKPFTVSSFGS